MLSVFLAACAVTFSPSSGFTSQVIECGNYAGIGMTYDPQTFEVVAIWEDGPAARAGIRIGDVFVSVNGTAVSSTASVQQLVVNPPGTRLEITLRRPSRDALVRVSLETECIPASFGTLEDAP